MTLLGQGPNFLGHAPEQVVDAVAEACPGGVIYGGQHEVEVRASELVCRALGWADMVRFGVSGTESVQGALRLARGATGRTKVVRALAGRESLMSRLGTGEVNHSGGAGGPGAGAACRGR